MFPPVKQFAMENHDAQEVNHRNEPSIAIYEGSCGLITR
jgi:hypothetical protein